MPQVEHSRELARSRLMRWVGGVLIVVAIGVVVVGFMLVKHPAPQPTAKELADKTNTLVFKGKYEEAAQLSIEKYKASTSQDDKYQLALSIGTIYEGNKDYKSALSWYEKAQTHTAQVKDRGVSSGLARCYEALGDKPNAAKHYQIVLDSIDRTKLGWQAEVSWYTRAVKRMSE